MINPITCTGFPYWIKKPIETSLTSNRKSFLVQKLCRIWTTYPHNRFMIIAFIVVWRAIISFSQFHKLREAKFPATTGTIQWFHLFKFNGISASTSYGWFSSIRYLGKWMHLLRSGLLYTCPTTNAHQSSIQMSQWMSLPGRGRADERPNPITSTNQVKSVRFIFCRLLSGWTNGLMDSFP